MSVGRRRSSTFGNFITVRSLNVKQKLSLWAPGLLHDADGPHSYPWSTSCSSRLSSTALPACSYGSITNSLLPLNVCAESMN